MLEVSQPDAPTRGAGGLLLVFVCVCVLNVFVSFLFFLLFVVFACTPNRLCVSVKIGNHGCNELVEDEPEAIPSHSPR